MIRAVGKDPVVVEIIAEAVMFPGKFDREEASSVKIRYMVGL